MTCCPTCGRRMTTPRAETTLGPVDTALMSDAELTAHYRRTAPIENVRFHLRLRTVPSDIRAGLEALLTDLERQRGKETGDQKREYQRLLRRWCERTDLRQWQPMVRSVLAA